MFGSNKWKERALEAEQTCDVYRRELAGLYADRKHGVGPAPRVLEQALRNAFSHFANGEEITLAAITAIGKEYTDMVMGWAPVPTEIEFVDQDGLARKLTYESGDASVGLSGGWTVPEDADWLVLTNADHAALLDAAEKAINTEAANDTPRRPTEEIVEEVMAHRRAEETRDDNAE